MPLPFFKKKEKKETPRKFSDKAERQESKKSIKKDKPAKPPEKESKAPSQKKDEGAKTAEPAGGYQLLPYQFLKRPHVTEKATYLTDRNQYIFEVWPRANKTEIKKAVERVYGVNVTGVNIINVPPKKRRLGRTEGWRKGYKKAIIQIKEGQKIEVLPR